MIPAKPFAVAVMITISVIPTLFGDCPSGAAQCGLISTRPGCSPGVNYASNYVQSAEPILRANGDVDILVNAGYLTLTAGSPWEGLFVLRYPSTTHAAPHWYPIWGSNNWGTDMDRDESEAAHASLMYQNGAWRIAYSSTRSYADRPNACTSDSAPTDVCSNNWDRVGRIDLPDLLWSATPAQVTSAWVDPVDPSCQPFGSCAAPYSSNPPFGSGLLPAYLPLNASTFLYHEDGSAPSYKGCPTPWIRSVVTLDQQVFFDSCLSFTPNIGEGAPTQIWDVAQGSDGALYMLADVANYNISTIYEWKSVANGGIPAGVAWTRTSRTWIAPTADGSQGAPALTNNYVYSVSNAAYVKNENRTITEPRIVISNITSGNHFGCAPNDPPSCYDDSMSAVTGRWMLYYWADQNAVLPSGFGSDAGSCSFSGDFDTIDNSQITGWAWDSFSPSTRVDVDLFDGETYVQTIPCATYRGDLQAAGIGDGAHAFIVTTPESFNDGATHSIHLRYQGTNEDLPNSPRSFSIPPHFEGNQDSTSCSMITGWAWNSNQPTTAISVDIYDSSTYLETIPANLYRGDLAAAGKGNGVHAFQVPTPSVFQNGAQHSVLINYGGTSTPISNSPVTLTCTLPPAPANVTATSTSGTSVTITWSAVIGADHYEVSRRALNGFVVLASTVANSPFVDGTAAENTSYLYYVRSFNTSNIASGYSAPDLTTTVTFVDDPLVAGSTVIKAAHIDQLRQAVNAVRALAGLSPSSFTDVSVIGLAMKTVHIQELRSNLDAARSSLGLAALMYTDDPITPGSTVIKALHIGELRNGVK